MKINNIKSINRYIINSIFQTIIVIVLILLVKICDIEYSLVNEHFGILIYLLIPVYIFKCILPIKNVFNKSLVLSFITNKNLIIDKKNFVGTIIIAILTIGTVVFSLYRGEWEITSWFDCFCILLCLLERFALFSYLISFVLMLQDLNLRTKVLNLLRFADKKGFVKFANVVLVFVSIIILLLNIYRFYLYTAVNAFWGDEVFFIRLCNMQFIDLVKASINDCNPPLHYILTRLLILIFGVGNPFIYRFFSFFPYVVCFVHGFAFFSKKFNILSGSFWAILISTVYYSMYHMMDARMYYLAFLFTYFMYISIFNILNREKIFDWVILLFNSVLLLYTHTYGVLYVFFLYIALLLTLLIRKASIRKIFVLYFITVLMYIPWIGVLFKQFNRVTNIENLWIPKLNPFSIFPSFFLLQKNNGTDKTYIVCILVTFFIIILMVYRFINILKRNYTIIRTYSSISIFLVIGAIAVFAPIGFSYVVSAVYRPIVVFRYLFPLTSIVFVVSIIILNYYKMKTVILIFLCILVSAIGIKNISFDLNQREYINTSFASTLEIVKNNLSHDLTGLIYSDHAHISWNVAKYYFPLCDVDSIQNANITDETLKKPILLMLNFETSWTVINDFCVRHGLEYKLICEYGQIGDRYKVNIFKVEKL